jgi:hypothetical protein
MRGGVERPKNSPISKGKKSPVILVIAGVVLIGLIVVWWFVLFNPSPVPAAKAYMTTRLQEVARTLAVMPMPGGMPGGMKLEMGDVKDTRIKGDTAEVSIDMKITYMGKNGTGPTRVALKKQGSILKKEWQVDVTQTNDLQTADMGVILSKIMVGLIKSGKLQLPGVGG